MRRSGRRCCCLYINIFTRKRFEECVREETVKGLGELLAYQVYFDKNAFLFFFITVIVRGVAEVSAIAQLRIAHWQIWKTCVIAFCGLRKQSCGIAYCGPEKHIALPTSALQHVREISADRFLPQRCCQGIVLRKMYTIKKGSRVSRP